MFNVYSFKAVDSCMWMYSTALQKHQDSKLTEMELSDLLYME